MKVISIPNIILKLFIISFFLESYCFFHINDYPFRVSTIIMIITLVYGLINLLKKGISIKKSNIPSTHIALLMCFYLFINWFITGQKNIYSMLLSIFYFIIAFLFSPTIKVYEFNKLIAFFQLCINITAIYGIYQIFARYFNLPFSDLIIEDHMVKGYNWSNLVYFDNIILSRSNAIYLEPSFFSQFLAFNILIYINNYINNKSSNRYFVMIIINIIALLVTFSGTGFLILGLSSVLLCIIKYKSIKINIIIRLIIITFISIVILNLFIDVFAIFSYLTSRINEFSMEKSSASTRYTNSLFLLKEAWNYNMLFGVGIGNIHPFISTLITKLYLTNSNGIIRPAVELGLIGVLFWLSFLYKLKNNWIWEIENAKIIYIFLFPFLLGAEMFQTTYFWIIVYLINCNIEK